MRRYIEYIIYISRINKRLVFKIKEGFKLELQKPETLKLYECTKKLIDQIKNGENAEEMLK